MMTTSQAAATAAFALAIACSLALPVHEADDSPKDAGVATPNAKLLFRSGFEDGVVLDPPQQLPGNLGNFSQAIHGADDGGSPWPITLPGLDAGSGFQLFVVEAPFDAAALPSVMSNEIVEVSLADGGRSHALHQFRANDGANSYHFTPSDSGLDLGSEGKLYIRYWLKLDSKQLGDGTTRKLFKLYQRAADANVEPYIEIAAHGSAGNDISWDIAAHYPPQSSGSEWTTAAGSVMKQDWYRLEIFVDPRASNDGRVWVAVNGQKVAERLGPVMIGDEPLDDIYLLLDEYSVPADQWIDDLEIWDGFPDDAAAH